MGGPVKDKIAFERDYKFTMCFENTSSIGYTSEKIMEAFAGRTVPIYWGNPDIAEEFNPEAFINCHDFDSFEEVLEEIKRLDADDDAATKNWGEGWRMPTRQEFADLISDEYTTHEWVTVNGVTGQKITSKSNGNSIFLPATGYRNNVALYYNDTNGYYWTNTVSTDFNYDACMLCFSSSGLSTNTQNRFNGQVVRAVRVAK